MSSVFLSSLFLTVTADFRFSVQPISIIVQITVEVGHINQVFSKLF